MDERTTETELLLHAARQLARRPIGKRIEPGGLQEGGDARPAFSRGLREQLPKKVQVLEDAQLRIEILAQALGHIGDAWADGPAMAGIGHVATEHVDGAGLKLARARNQAQQGRFADAVGAEESDHAAGGDLHRHGIEGPRFPIEMRDPRHAHNHGAHAGHGSSGLQVGG